MLKLSLFAVLLTSVAATAKPLEARIDELVATPKQFNGKRVSVTGYFGDRNHDAL
jgi:hypothetical protein